MAHWGSLIVGLGLCSVACAMPEGFKSVAGSASIVTSQEQTMVIKAKGPSIVQWDDFSTSAQEAVVFKLPSSKSAILNRVATSAKSKLYGKIDSNGKVYIVNPNGIVVGPNANLTARGVILTTGQISDDEFLNGGPITVHSIGVEKGRIINLGTIECPTGDVFIISKRIINNGSLIATEGHVGLAMGEEVLIKPEGPERIFIKAGETRAAGEHITAIDNHGKIEALVTELKTNANIYAQAIRHSGTIDATSTKNENGRVYLVAKGSRVIGHGKINAEGGDVKIDAAKDVTLIGEALIDVSHATHPGLVEIGSENCGSVSVSEAVVIKADATGKGNGGRINILSAERNRFDGHISAEGTGGNGGNVDVSSKNHGLEYRGTVSLKGHGGQDGNLVLDPKFIVVQELLSPYSDPATGQTFASDPTGSVTISTADLSAALDSANVTLQANTDITMNDAIVGATSGNGLTLQSGRSIIFDPSCTVTLNNGAFSATINDQNAISADRDSGTAKFNLFGAQGVNSIDTQGGDISVNVGTFGGSQTGMVIITQANIDAGGGNISIEGFGSSAAAEGAGVAINSPVQISTNSTGTINITGTGGSNSANCFGIYSSGSESFPSLITAVDGNVNVTGNGGGNGAGSFNCGCYLTSIEVSTTGAGAAEVHGTGGTGSNLNCGVILTGSAAHVTSETGSVIVEGTGTGTLEFNYGVRLEGGGKVTSTGSATVSVTGDGGAAATACNVGVILSGRGSDITSTGGTITINGDGGGSAYLNQGVRLESNAAIEATNSSAINITGNGSGSNNYDNGIYVSGVGSHITSANGNIDLNGTGTGAGPSNQGVILEYPAENAFCTGTGTLTINSTP